MTLNRYEPNEAGPDGLQRRYFELRYDEGSRRISGTVIRYGDEASFGTYYRERFEPGAFGDPSSIDATLNVQHDRSRLIGRSAGGGMTFRETPNELTMEAVLPDTSEANDAMVLIRSRVLRGLSVEFVPEETREETGPKDRVTTIVTRAKLRGVGIVDRPAYKQSKVKPRQEENTMDEKAIEALVEQKLADAAKGDDKLDVRALAVEIAKGLPDVDETVDDKIAAVLKERDEAEEARAKAEQEKADAEAKAKTDSEEAEVKAEARADLLVMLRDLLPKDTEVRGKTNKDLLVLAVGDEVEGAEDRSEDYLLAKVEAIVERRDEADDKRKGKRTDDPEVHRVRTGGDPILNVIRLRGRPEPASVRGGDSD